MVSELLSTVASLQVLCYSRRRCEESDNEPTQQTAEKHGKLLSRTGPEMRSASESPKLPVLWCKISKTCCFRYSCSAKHFKHSKIFLVLHKGDVNHIRFSLWKLCGCIVAHMCTVTFTPTLCCSVRRFYDSFDKNKILHLLS